MLNVLRKILNPRKSNFSQPRPGIDSVRRREGNLIESFMGKLSLSCSWTSWESLHGLWEAAKTNIDFRSLGEVLQDLALDEARHAVVPLSSDV